MLRKLLLSFVVAVGIVAALGGGFALQIRSLIAFGESYVPDPDVISTVEVEPQIWRKEVAAIGSVVAVQGVMVSAEVGGKVVSFSFESGAEVQEGDVLVELDASTELAQLKAAESDARLAEINLQRSRELLAREAISQSDYDATEAHAQNARAQVETLGALLEKKTLRAPFSGRLGIRQVNLGQYVASGSPVVSLQSVDPVFVDFFLPQQHLATIREGYEVEVLNEIESQTGFRGTISAIESEVDTSTRNVRMRAILTDTGGNLRPGMFVRVRVIAPEQWEVSAIPVTSVLYAPYGNSVFVVETNEAGVQVARQRFVRLGEARGDFVEVLRGVDAGEAVVSNGAFKLRNGMPVKVDNQRVPTLELFPEPAEA